MWLDRCELTVRHGKVLRIAHVDDVCALVRSWCVCVCPRLCQCAYACVCFFCFLCLVGVHVRRRRSEHPRAKGRRGRREVPNRSVRKPHEEATETWARAWKTVMSSTDVLCATPGATGQRRYPVSVRLDRCELAVGHGKCLHIVHVDDVCAWVRSWCVCVDVS